MAVFSSEVAAWCRSTRLCCAGLRHRFPYRLSRPVKVREREEGKNGKIVSRECVVNSFLPALGT